MPIYRTSPQPRGRSRAAQGAGSGRRPSAPRPPVVRETVLTGLEEHTSTDLRAGAYADLTRYAGAELSGADLTGLELVECELADARADGAHLVSSRLSQCRLERVSAAELTAQRSTWHEVTLTGSRIGALSAYDSGWRQVILTSSRISHLDLGRADLLDVDLRGAVLDVVDDVAGLRGATVGTEQLVSLAPAMAAHLGLRVL